MKYKKTKNRRSANRNKTIKYNRKKGGQKNFPLRVHQIWFGLGDIPPVKHFLIEKNRKICKDMDVKYNLWVESDRDEDNFPITYKYQQKVIELGNELGQSRWAQVADLARLEIIYRYGGIYIDSIVEISPLFLDTMKELMKKYDFIGSNEDPCGLECYGNGGKKYLSNSFFATTKHNIILKRLLDKNILDNIDYESVYINRTTGPYYLRSGIMNPEEEKVFLLDTDQIYPYNVNESNYRLVHPNDCLYKNIPDNSSPEYFIEVKEGMYYKKNCLKDKQEKPILAIYNSGLGGTWSL
jgi:hypothetical protein